VWEVPVKIKVFDLKYDSEDLIPVKMGGGQQTYTLRLEDSKGKQYVLRSVIKDPTKGLRFKGSEGFLGKIIRDQNTAENPYAPLILSVLSKAVGIFYTLPELVFVPSGLLPSEYDPYFKNSLALLEQRPDGDHSEDENFGNAPLVIGTKKVLEHFYSDHKYMIDQELYARCRLFDMLIGDWGRHEDQWRWALVDSGEKVLVRPIPRDRDHAFYKFNDGLLPYIASRIQPKLQSFKCDYGNIKSLTSSGAYLDPKFLNGLTEGDWIRIAEDMKRKLTDYVIENAVRKWPKEIYDLIGKETEIKLKARRDKLLSAALKFYSILNKYVEVPATDENEIFIIRRNERSTELLILVNNDSLNDTIFYLAFNNKHTKEIFIYGLGGNDVFIVKGNARRGSKVILSG
jgi:hypothetical protein